jgi:hypothetical protein
MAQKSSTRKISGCGPADFRFLNDESDGTNGRPDDTIMLEFGWQNLAARWEYMSLEVVNRAGSRFSAENWHDACTAPQPTTLVGFPASLCLITRDNLNGVPLEQSDDWGIEIFVETSDYWIIADAAGPQTGPDRQPAIDRALSAFASIHANGLARLK